MAAAALVSACGPPAPTGATPAIRHSPAPLAAAPVQATLQWFPVTVGPENLVEEGTSIGSVLAGPDNRLYYGTENPLGSANVIGWVDPVTGQRTWRTVPPLAAPFPPKDSPGVLGLPETAYWGQVQLVVAGGHTVWYRYWGYVGGLNAAGRFVAGTYNHPGPTVHSGNLTASLAWQPPFTGSATVIRVMNLANGRLRSYPGPAVAAPQALELGPGGHHLWLLGQHRLWQLNLSQGTWRPVLQLNGPDFWVSLGSWGQTLWVVDADGRLGLIRNGRFSWAGTLPVTPLAVIAGGDHGLWIAGPHHLSWWQNGRTRDRWAWPQLVYPPPASSWPTDGTAVPPNWPPTPHLAPAAGGRAIIGYGLWVGLAQPAGGGT